MRNRIRVETEEDSLYLADEKIHAIAESKEHIYELSSVNKILVLPQTRVLFMMISAWLLKWEMMM